MSFGHFYSQIKKGEFSSQIEKGEQGSSMDGIRWETVGNSFVVGELLIST